MPNPGGMQVDRSPAAQCCLHNTEATESTLAYCACQTVADDCEAKATAAHAMIVSTCPPP